MFDISFGVALFLAPIMIGALYMCYREISKLDFVLPQQSIEDVRGKEE